jgi:oligoendopeptidase F
MDQSPPHWDLTNVYPGLETAEFNTALDNLKQKIVRLEILFKEQVTGTSPEKDNNKLANLIGEFLDQLNQTLELSGTIRAYISSYVSTDSRNLTARRIQSEFDQIGVQLRKLSTQFRSWIGKLSPMLNEIIPKHPTTQAHAFMLYETAEQSQYLMSEAEETLSAELSLSGSSAWARLQGTISSQLSADFELDGQVNRLPLPAIINLHSHPDESVRKRAYETELSLLDSVREPLAACMNGIKGTVNTLNRHRGRQDALHSSIDTARIDRQTLEAMLGAMQASFPIFRKYFLTKARRIGKEKLAWWDLWAPVSDGKKMYTFAEASQFILEHFTVFTPHLADLAKRAFDNHWIDGEQRDGKRGGAFCMGVPGVKESRVLCNFDGSLGQVSTIAHELGHAYHNHCAFEAGKTELQRSTPMTMAETASIMCETIIKQAVLNQVSDPQDELAILETILIGDSQVIVDIYSRYLFEKEVFERREKSELSADDFCVIMEQAQKATYGEGLDETHLNKYMWAWKPHYYSEGLSFYNYPYSFGLLFGIGLFAIYQQRGSAFIPDYQKLLASTGEASAAELALRFGINIGEQKFWEDSLSVIAQRIERYCLL